MLSIGTIIDEFNSILLVMSALPAALRVANSCSTLSTNSLIAWGGAIATSKRMQMK